MAQPEAPSTKVIRDLNAKHPLLVGFTVNVPKDYNKYGVTIGKYEKDLEKASLSEIRNVEVVPILAVSRRELEDFNRLRQVKDESEAILAEIDNRKDEELFVKWRKDPTVQILINSDLKGERTSEIGLIDMEKVRPGEAITVSNKLVLKQKVDRTGGFSGKDKEQARRFQENSLAIDYFSKLNEYKKIHAAYQRASDGNTRVNYQNLLYGDDNGKIRGTDDLAYEPYLKTHYSEVLSIMQNRGVELQGSDEIFARNKKGKLEFKKEGWQEGHNTAKDFMFKTAGTLKPANRKKILNELGKLDKENRQIAVKGGLDQLKGEVTYYTVSHSLEPVARDLTVQEGDKKTREKSGAAFKDVIFQDLGKLRAIRQWQEGQDTDDKTKTRQWAVFVHDGINRAIANREPHEAKRLGELKTLKMNPMMMEESDLHFIESRLGVVFPAKPKTKEFEVDFIKDQVVFPVETPARTKFPPKEVDFVKLPPPSVTVREFEIPDVPTFKEEPLIERPMAKTPEPPPQIRLPQTETERPPLRFTGTQFSREIIDREKEEAILRGEYIPSTLTTERPSKHKRRRN